MKRILIIVTLIILVCVNIADDTDDNYVTESSTVVIPTIEEKDIVIIEAHATKIISKNEFIEMNSYLESRGNYKIANRYKYVGKYQFGKLALTEMGYNETWIDSVQSSVYYKLNSKGVKIWYFDLKLFPPEAQEDAICKFYHIIEKRYIKNDIEKYVGKTIDGVYITKAGLIGASMLGCGNVHTFLSSNGENNPKDGNGTSVRSRLKHFQDVELKACF